MQHNGKRLKIAIACSGLGHIQRGIETWAADLSRALHEAGEDVTLFQGSGTEQEDWQQVIGCSRRFDPQTQAWVNRMRRAGGWRYGLGSGYQLEQTTFSMKLWPRIRAGYDILHVQDPYLAEIMEQLYRRRLSRPRVILAHGTEEPIKTLQKYSFLQHLAPCYAETWEENRPEKQKVYAVPNFVSMQQFAPANRCAAREAWNLPQNALIVLCVAAIKRTHKRMDALIEEFAAFAEHFPAPTMLVIAGGREPESDSIITAGREQLGGRMRLMEGVGRGQIASLYQAADVFALASLHEMMPIAVLEALATGLPIACNDTPTLRWMVSDAGCLNDIAVPGNLAAQLQVLADPERRAALSHAARLQAAQNFSTEAVVNQIRAMYRDVMEASGR